MNIIKVTTSNALIEDVCIQFSDDVTFLPYFFTCASSDFSPFDGCMTVSEPTLLLTLSVKISHAGAGIKLASDHLTHSL